ncbi:MAG TPA: sulfite exporter TauE/SafE family protein [Gemmatimonadaceae bacterium]
MTILGVLVASLLGSAHCAAMCGPFVSFYSTSDTGGRRSIASHLFYHLARLAAYLVLGAVAGSLGSGVDRLGTLAGVTRLAAIVAAVIMVTWGTATVLAWHGVRVRWLHGPSWARRPLHAAVARARAWPTTARAGVLGATTALLPCGWLYAFVAVAGGTGSALRGMLAMFVFWIGTLPMLAALGAGIQRAAGPLRARLPVLTAVVVVVLGLATIGERLRTAHPARVPAAAHAEHR